VNSQGYDHFIIIENIKNEQLHIVDPGNGKYKIDKNEFEKVWSNIVVLIEKMKILQQKMNHLLI
ncbi:cysteine peptidase family C39 domain-containing protein, partial [Staphylococcus cohnii]|uniref:cysteine peptidase family C39 domain-containing protein n=1 Tax=Staphylococcus cohnii TaxID=29382 RepID=UPI003879FBBF